MCQIFVSGLSYSIDDHNLREEFANYGTIVEGISFPFLGFTHLGTALLLTDALSSSAKIIMDRETGRSRGFGFVTYTSSEEASAAITALDGKVSIYFFLICTLLSNLLIAVLALLTFCICFQLMSILLK
jgi:RNA recognition motif-containing protein